jgi:flagellar basal-body rod modification protein FlgD
MAEISPVSSGIPDNLFSETNGVLDKDDFLNLLVTQLRHQDPLEPMDAQDFGAQLAQFSSLEQLQNINETLKSSVESNHLLNQGINNTMATTLIGSEVQANGNVVQWQGDDPVLFYTLPTGAQDMTITVYDSGGTAIRSMQLGSQAAGEYVHEWDGRDANGEKMPRDVYGFTIDAVDVNGDAIQAETYVRGMVESVRYADGTALLMVGELEVPLASVTQISRRNQ